MKTGFYIFVEGSDDSRFINKVIRPVIEDEFNFIKIIEYAQKSKDAIERFKRFIKSINSMPADYIFLGDLDLYDCFLDKIESIIDTFDVLDKEKVYVVIKEMESWYLAGIDSSCAKSLDINHFRDTEKVDKEKFLALMPESFDSVIDYKQELLKCFSIDTAVTQNDSFRYFYNNVV